MGGVGYDPWVEVQTVFKGLVDKNDLWCIMHDVAQNLQSFESVMPVQQTNLKFNLDP